MDADESRGALIDHLADRYQVADEDRALLTATDEASLEAQARRLGELRDVSRSELDRKRHGGIAPKEGNSPRIEPDPEHDVRDFVDALFGNNPWSY